MAKALIEGDFTITYLADPPPVEPPPSTSPSAYSPGALFGGTLSNSISDAANDIAISPVKCRDLADTGNIVVATASTKRLDAEWSAGDGGGFLDAGVKQPSTWYHVFAIRNPDTGDCDHVASTSAVNPTMPAGFTQKRRLGAVVTDTAGAIRGFIQNGGWFHFTGVTPVPAVTNALISTAVRLKLPVPTGIKVLADFTALLSGASGNPFLAVRDPDAGNAAIYDGVASGPALVTGGQLLCWTNTLGEVSFFGSAASSTVNIYPRGWYDGRDTYV